MQEQSTERLKKEKKVFSNFLHSKRISFSGITTREFTFQDVFTLNAAIANII